ncbi:MAG: tetratricopeptide repeat protein, partial [Myxococcales bacterium]
MAEDDLARGSERSAPPSFDFDDEAITALLDTFVETQTGRQSKRPSRPSDPSDAGARVAQRTVFEQGSRHDRLPLVGDSSETRTRRITLLKALAERSVGSVRARLLTAAAELQEQLGDADGAVLCYEAALAADARDVVVLRALVRHAIRRRDWAAAANVLQREAALDLTASERAAALRLLAVILLYKRREPAAAEQAAGHAVALCEDDFVAHILVASACLARNEPRRAAEALIAAAERWPVSSQQAVVWLHAAGLMEQAHEPASAKSLFERVLEQEPDWLPARLGVVRCARALGDRQGAVEEIQTAAVEAEGPVATALRRMAGAIAAATGDRRGAEAMFGGATDAASRWTRIEMAVSEHDVPRAIEALEAHAIDDTETIRAIDSARRARLAAEVADQGALLDAVAQAEPEPLLQPYLRALRRLCPTGDEQDALGRLLETVPRDGAIASVARTDEAAADLGAFCGALAEEQADTPPRYRVGASLALAQAAATASTAERSSVLLDAERTMPGDPILNRALWLVDGDVERNASRWRAESDRTDGIRAASACLMAARCDPSAQAWDDACESALEREPGYWPALWALEMHSPSVEARARAARNQARLDPEHATDHLLRASLWTRSPAEASADAEASLQREAPDPLLVEHLIDSYGHATEAAGDLMRLMAAKRGDPSYLLRAAAAYRGAGLPARAARTLREAEAATPNDVLVRVQRTDAELEAGEFARLADSAMQRARAAEDENEQLGAFCVMAEADRLARHDMQSARLSLQSIAEMRPEHVPTARTLEWDALREQDTERIRSSARRLVEALEPGSAEGIARRRLTFELLRTDPDILRSDLDRMLRGIDERLDADLGLARLVLGAAYAKREGLLAVSALGALRRALTDEQGSCALLLEEAAVLRDVGQTEGALERLHDARSHPLALEEEARLLQSAKRWEEAAAAYVEAAQRAQSRRRAASLWREAAVILEERVGDDARATRAWTDAAAADITYLDVYRRLASQFQSRGQEEDLASLIQARIDAGADTPTLVSLLLEQAEQRRAHRDLDGVIDSLREALELDPQHFTALAKIVDALREAEDWQGVTESLIRIARLKRSREDQAWAFIQLGEIYHEQLGDLERAEASLRRAQELDPGHVETLDRLASVLATAGKPLEAARLLDQLARRASSVEQARDYRIRLAVAVEQAGQAKQAETMLEALRAERPTDPDLVLALADFYERRDDLRAEAMHLNRAVNDLRTTIDENPKDEASWTTLVRVLHRRHGPGPASCAASAAIALGHPASLFEGDVTSKFQALGRPTIPLAPVVDSIVAPSEVPQTVRRLFTLCEHSFDKLLPFDAGAWRLRKPSSEHRSMVEEAGAIAEALGIGEPRLKLTYIAPVACIPISGDPPTLVVGGHLQDMTTPEERVFLFARALKVA